MNVSQEPAVRYCAPPALASVRARRLHDGDMAATDPMAWFRIPRSRCSRWIVVNVTPTTGQHRASRLSDSSAVRMRIHQTVVPLTGSADDRRFAASYVVLVALLLPDAAGDDDTSARALRNGWHATPRRRRHNTARDDLTLRERVSRGKYTGLELQRLYYTATTPPERLRWLRLTIVSVQRRAERRCDFQIARVIGDPTAAIHDVWVTYTGGQPGRWACQSR